jgi:integral membrane protein (TIGR01906 family)
LAADRGLTRRLTALTGFVAGIALIGALLVGAVAYKAADMDFYAAEYAKYGNAAALGMSGPDLLAATAQLLSYLRGEAPDMNIRAVIAGRTQEMFNEREKTHMVDVRLLYGHMLRAGAAGAALGLLGAGLLVWRRGWRRGAAAWGRGYLKALAAAAGVFLVLVAVITRDFTAFWTNFHGVFFTNDLWLLDPETDRMIVMFPEGFFFDLVEEILRLWTICAGGAGVLAGGAALFFRKDGLVK